MKFILIALALFSQAAFALPVICESHEKSDGISILRVKINEKSRVVQNGAVWSLHKIGITPVGPGEMRTIMYGSGNILPETIHMTIVKDGFVYGYVDLQSPQRNSFYSGKIRIGGILRGRIINVTCTDEGPAGNLI